MTPTQNHQTGRSTEIIETRSDAPRTDVRIVSAALLVWATLSSCGIENPLDPDPAPIRILSIEFAEVSPALSDEEAMNAMRTGTSFFTTAQEFSFPTSDSSFGRLVNRVIVTPASGTNNGSTQLFGGQNFERHPAQAGVPSSMLITVGGVNGPGQTGTFGVFEVNFNDDELVVGSGVNGDDMEFVLESVDTETTQASGRFLFVARNLTDPTDTRRWGFKGAFTLREE